MEESVLLGTNPLADSIRHFIRDPRGLFSVCHLCDVCPYVTFCFCSIFSLHIIKRTLHVGSKIWILCSRGKNNISLVSLRSLEHKIHIFSPACNILYLLLTSPGPRIVTSSNFTKWRPHLGTRYVDVSQLFWTTSFPGTSLYLEKVAAERGPWERGCSFPTVPWEPYLWFMKKKAPSVAKVASVMDFTRFYTWNRWNRVCFRAGICLTRPQTFKERKYVAIFLDF